MHNIAPFIEPVGMSFTVFRPQEQMKVWKMAIFFQTIFGLFAGSFFLGGEGVNLCFFCEAFHQLDASSSWLEATSPTVDSVNHPGEDCERLICNECARPLANEWLAWGVAGAKRVGCT